jgi:LAO/AO transport system kinase
MQSVPAHHGVNLASAAERESARRAMNPARAAREAAHGDGARGDATSWTPPVLASVAAKGEGLGEVVGALDRHFHYLESSGTLAERRRRRMRERVVEVVEQRVRRRLWNDAETAGWLDAHIPDIESGASTPYLVADELLARSGDLISGDRT